MLAVGSNSCINSSCFGTTSPPKLTTPVMLPPGRPRLATSPTSTGSTAAENTIGSVATAALLDEFLDAGLDDASHAAIGQAFRRNALMPIDITKHRFACRELGKPWACADAARQCFRPGLATPSTPLA
jgi:hypothetical protein